MLRRSRQNEMSFHSELYAMILEDHLLKKIDAVVDFGFIFDLVEDSYCLHFGRPANEPEVLFRLLFIQYMYKLSDERVVSEAQVNLAYKRFLGLNPEDPIPDGSQLSRFRNHRLGVGQVDDVLAIGKQCVDKGLIKSKVLIVDSTHTLAASQRQKPLDVLKDAAKKLYRVVVKRHPKLEKRLPRVPHTANSTESSPRRNSSQSRPSCKTEQPARLFGNRKANIPASFLSRATYIAVIAEPNLTGTCRGPANIRSRFGYAATIK